MADLRIYDKDGTLHDILTEEKERIASEEGVTLSLSQVAHRLVTRGAEELSRQTEPVSQPDLVELSPSLHYRGKPDRLLRDTEVASMLGIGRSTFLRWVASGDVPQPIKMQGCTRWWQSEIEGYLAALSEERNSQ